jgi:type IV pilus assembly protein PilN
MANINLLPWREELRAEKKRQFFSILGLSAIVGALMSVLIHMTFNAKIENQVNRNKYLTNQITELDQKIQEIQKLEQQREDLLNRMQIVQSLQQSRPLVVRLFDEVVRVLPTGVTIKSFERKGRKLIMKGEAESTPRISAFMRNIEASPWLTKPDVSDIKAVTNKKGSVPITTFSMTAVQKKLENTKNAAGGKR